VRTKTNLVPETLFLLRMQVMAKFRNPAGVNYKVRQEYFRS
jgi:hypothetical protein